MASCDGSALISSFWYGLLRWHDLLIWHWRLGWSRPIMPRKCLHTHMLLDLMKDRGMLGLSSNDLILVCTNSGHLLDKRILSGAQDLQ